MKSDFLLSNKIRWAKFPINPKMQPSKMRLILCVNPFKWLAYSLYLGFYWGSGWKVERRFSVVLISRLLLHLFMVDLWSFIHKHTFGATQKSMLVSQTSDQLVLPFHTLTQNAASFFLLPVNKQFINSIVG